MQTMRLFKITIMPILSCDCVMVYRLLQDFIKLCVFMAFLDEVEEEAVQFSLSNDSAKFDNYVVIFSTNNKLCRL